MKSPLSAEENYAFRMRLDTVHHRDRRDHRLQPLANECCLRDGWSIGVVAGCSEVIRQAANDLQDYLFVSMGGPCGFNADKENIIN